MPKSIRNIIKVQLIFNLGKKLSLVALAVFGTDILLITGVLYSNINRLSRDYANFFSVKKLSSNSLIEHFTFLALEVYSNNLFLFGIDY